MKKNLTNNCNSDNGNVDRYIETLWKCQPLAESDVKILCEKVIFKIKYQFFSIQS